MSPDDVRRRVRRGAALLDVSCTDDWRERIDPRLLDVGCSRWCVLGQVYPDDRFNVAAERLGMPLLDVDAFEASRVDRNAWCVEYGFDVPSGTDWRDVAVLTAAWRDYLQSERTP